MQFVCPIQFVPDTICAPIQFVTRYNLCRYSLCPIQFVPIQFVPDTIWLPFIFLPFHFLIFSKSKINCSIVSGVICDDILMEKNPHEQKIRKTILHSSSSQHTGKTANHTVSSKWPRIFRQMTTTPARQLPGWLAAGQSRWGQLHISPVSYHPGRDAAQLLLPDEAVNKVSGCGLPGSSDQPDLQS